MNSESAQSQPILASNGHTEAVNTAAARDFPEVRGLLLGLSAPGGDMVFFRDNCLPLAAELRQLLTERERAATLAGHLLRVTEDCWPYLQHHCSVASIKERWRAARAAITEGAEPSPPPTPTPSVLTGEG
jgi:hypothetical protein